MLLKTQLKFFSPDSFYTFVTLAITENDQKIFLKNKQHFNLKKFPLKSFEQESWTITKNLFCL